MSCIKHRYNQTGCPAQAKAMPPQVADTITTTKSDINLQRNKHKTSDKLIMYMQKQLQKTITDSRLP